MTTTRYAALLRGVNVGGNRKMPMAELRMLCESIGCTDVTTYIQSGNVVLGSPLTEHKLVTALEAAIAERFHMTSSVMVRTHEQLTRILTHNPFPSAEARTLHVGFLPKEIADDAIARLAQLSSPPEEFVVRKREIYLHLPNGMGRAMLPAALLDTRRLGVPVTARNWRTVTKLAEMTAE